MDSRNTSSRRRAQRRLGIIAVVVSMTIGAGAGTTAAAAAPQAERDTTRAAIQAFTGSLDDFYRVPSPLRRAPRGDADPGARPGHRRRRDDRSGHVPLARRATTTTARSPASSRTPSLPRRSGDGPSWRGRTVRPASLRRARRAGRELPRRRSASGVCGSRPTTSASVRSANVTRTSRDSARRTASSTRYARRDSSRRRTPAPTGSRSDTPRVVMPRSFTNQVGQAYGIGLHLHGTVAIAPAAVLDRTFGPADQIVPRMVGIMALYGLATDYPQVHPDDYVGADVKARAGVIDTGCLDQIVSAMVTIPADTFYASSPLTTQPAVGAPRQRSRSRAGEVASPARLRDRGHVRGAARSMRSSTRCARSVRSPSSCRWTARITAPFPASAAPRIARWLTDRLGGAQPAPNSCPS